MSALDECLICGRDDHTCSRCGEPTSHVWPIHQGCLHPGEAPVYVGTATWPVSGSDEEGDR